MQGIAEFYNSLNTFNKISLWASIVSFISLVPMLMNLWRVISSSSPSKVLREFFFVYQTNVNYFLSIITGLAFVFLLLQSNSGINTSIIIIFFVSFLLLLLSFFVRQNKSIVRQLILSQIEVAVKKYGSTCSAIRFDVDLIVAINDFSYVTGNEIVTMIKKVLRKYESVLRKQDIDVVSIDIPEGDEVIWILPNTSVIEAADMADDIRRKVKRKLRDIPYYDDACQFAIKKLTNPPLTEEEKQGIGTVSAGVAAYTRGIESLLADISSASKEAKFRGRNRTIIYQREKPSFVRDH